jgi:cobalt-precorrin-5B (C1)-methyltransferase
VKVIEDDFGAMPDIPDGGWLERSEEGPLIVLSGGTGVGIVTRPGLKEEPGKAAINPVPRQMIFDAVKSACLDYDFQGCLSVEISVPGGEELAEKTFNPRLGIKGGISIFGTKGIVRPMSREAFLDSVALQISMLHEEGHSYLLAVPGNYGEAFAADDMNLKKAEPVLYGNFTGELIDMAAELGFRGILFVAHIGKFIKVSGGIMDTHSRMADCRAELAAAAALRAGIGAAGALKILDSATTDEALALMEEDSVLDPAMQYICGRVSFYLNNRSKGALEAEAVIYNNVKGELGRTKGADSMIDRILEDYG